MRDNPSDHDRLTTDAGKIPGTKWVTAFDAVAEAARFPAENPNPVFRVASDGRLLYANQASRQLMSAWRVADDGRVPPLWRERVAGLLASGESRKWEEPCEGRIFQLNCVPVQDAGYVNIYGADLTERVALENQLRVSEAAAREARDVLEQRVQERTAELRASKEQMRTLSRRLVAMQEAERSYVADQLYNQAGQVLAALQMQLSRFEREEWQDCPAELVPTMQATLSEAMRELHGLAMQLRPVGLDRSPLAGVLRAYVTEFGRAHGLLVRVCPGNADSLRLPADAATALYRSIQEGLSNVAGHAQASEITLSVSRDDECLAVVLADNGRGFEPESTVAAAGPGLASIRERLETVGGQLKVASGAAGTTLYMQVPLNREEQQV